MMDDSTSSVSATTPARFRRRALLTAAAAAGPVAVALKYVETAAANDVAGAWSAPFDMGGVAIHATLMHTDEVLFFQYVEGAAGVDRTSYVATWNWRTGQLREAPIAGPRDLFCAAHHVLPDGRVFVAGGHDPNTGKKQDALGVVENDIFDPVSRTWTRVAPLSAEAVVPDRGRSAERPGSGLRWHGQPGSRLPDGRRVRLRDRHPAPAAEHRQQGRGAVPADVPHGQRQGPAGRPSGHLDRLSTRPRTAGPTWHRWHPASARTEPSRCCRARSRSSPPVAELPTRTAEILDTAVASPRWRSTGSLIYRADAVERGRPARRPGPGRRGWQGVQVHPAP